MISADQDINYFIERQRSKLNKTNNRTAANQTRRGRPAPAPPPPPPPPPPAPRFAEPLDNRLDYQVARILDAPSPRTLPDPNMFPPSPRSPFPDPQQRMYSSSDETRSRQQMTDTTSENRLAFFDSFGTYDEKRAKLREDRNREYNEFLRSKDAAQRNKSNVKSTTARSNQTRRVQFQGDPTVIAPWEKDGKRTARNTQTFEETSSTVGISTEEYIRGRPKPKPMPDPDEEYIRAREEYILELYAQIRELEERKRLLELEGSRLANNTNSVLRAHYTEDLRALNSLLAERLNQRSIIDQELTRILNRPPVSASPTHLGAIGLTSLSPTFNAPPDFFSQRDGPPPPAAPGSQTQRPNGRNPRSGPSGTNGFQIGREVDKEAEQAAKKRYQQELQAQMREAQMRKMQAKLEKDQYDKKLEEDINRYNYFGRSGGGAPMRDRDGNIVANLADLRNPQQRQGPASQAYGATDDKGYSSGAGPSSITNAPFYNGQDGPNPSNTARTGSPNHARGAVSNGIFGTVKTEEQLAREEKYKQDLKRQIEEKRQRNAEEIARRRAEEERELAKHIEWQQQMEKQMVEETARKQEREIQERQQQEEIERQRQYEETMARRKPKRTDKARTPPADNQDGDRQNTMDEPPNQEPAYRSSSPPIPAIQNRGKKKKKTNDTRVNYSPPNDAREDQPRSPPTFNNANNTRSRGNELEELNENENENENENDDDRENNNEPQDESQHDPPVSGSEKTKREKHKEPLAPKKNPPSSYRIVRPQRTNSMTSLRSDGSDSETLKRLEHLKLQLKEKESYFQEQARRRRAEAALSDIEENPKKIYQPPTKLPSPRRSSPEYLLNTTRLPRRPSPTASDRLLRVLEDDEFKPSYFRDDSILMRGVDGYVSPAKRVDLVDGIFVTDIEDTARRRRYGLDSLKYFDRDDPTSMASLQLEKIAEQNEMRLKKLRDLERDDVSMLDSNEVLERFQRRQRMQQRGSLTTLQDDAWLK